MVEKARFIDFQSPTFRPVQVRVNAIEALTEEVAGTTVIVTDGGQFSVRSTIANVRTAITAAEIAPPALGDLTKADIDTTAAALRRLSSSNKTAFGAEAARLLRMATWLEDVSGDL